MTELKVETWKLVAAVFLAIPATFILSILIRAGVLLFASINGLNSDSIIGMIMKESLASAVSGYAFMYGVHHILGGQYISKVFNWFVGLMLVAITGIIIGYVNFVFPVMDKTGIGMMDFVVGVSSPIVAVISAGAYSKPYFRSQKDVKAGIFLLLLFPVVVFFSVRGSVVGQKIAQKPAAQTAGAFDDLIPQPVSSHQPNPFDQFDKPADQQDKPSKTISMQELDPDERFQVELACTGKRGVAAHNKCVAEQVEQLRSNPSLPEMLESVSTDERFQIELACTGERGVALHIQCVKDQIDQLSEAPRLR